MGGKGGPCQMAKMNERLVERRRYIRLRIPVSVTYAVSGDDRLHAATTKDISADGLRFETDNKNIRPDNPLELKLSISGAPNPVHVKGRVMWKKKLSLEDDAPFDVGVEFVEIEDDNKNTFLKFLCDILYNLPKETEDAHL